MLKIKKAWKIWNITNHFKEIDTKVWDNYQETNGVFQKYFFIRRIITRGKSHPQIIFSMMGEYAMFLMILNWLGIRPTITVQILGAAIVTLAILIVGVLDIFFEVDRKEGSWNSRFSPEAQQLYRQVDEIHKKLEVNNNGSNQRFEEKQKESSRLEGKKQRLVREQEQNALAHLHRRKTRIVLRPR